MQITNKFIVVSGFYFSILYCSMKHIMVIALIIFITSCSQIQRPTFQKITNIEVIDLNPDNITIKGKAIYHNPNPVAGKILKSNIDVSINEMSVGSIDQFVGADVVANGAFELEFEFTFPLSKLLATNNILGGIASMFVTQKFDLQFIGTTMFEFLGITFEIPVEFSESISTKISKNISSEN